MNERGPSMVDHWAHRAGTRDFCPALNIFFLTPHYFSSFVPIAEQPGQAAVLGCLPLSVCVSGCMI
jgi:hypothetical protein